MFFPLYLQSQKKLMGQSKEIKQKWKGPKKKWYLTEWAVGSVWDSEVIKKNRVIEVWGRLEDWDGL